MAGIRVNQDIINLLQSFKPFLGSKGTSLIEATEAVAQVLSTDHAQKAVEILKALNQPASSNPPDIITEKK